MKQHDFRTVLRKAIAVPIVALLLLALLLIAQISYLITTLQWVDHTDRAISSGRNLTRAMLEMESGLRGYLLTGYTTFLGPFETANAQIDPIFQELYELTTDNREQSQRVAMMRSDFELWRDYAKKMMALRQSGREFDDPDLNLEGRRLMQEVRRVRENFIAEEELLLSRRAAKARQVTILTFAVSGLTSIIVAVAISLYTRRQMLALATSYDLAMKAEVKAQEDLRHTERRLATTLRSIGEGVITTDAAGHIEYLNPVGEELTGYAAHEVKGRDVTEILRIVDDRTHEPVRDVVGEIARRGSIVDFGDHSLLVTRSGVELPIEHSGAPIVETDGVSTGLVFVFRDVSQRRKTEDALRSSEKLALIGRLSATIAHEIRNPLDAVSNVLYLLKSDPNTSDMTRESLAMGEQEVLRMGQIARQLLNYSRVSSMVEEVSIPEIMQGTVALFRPKLREQQIELGSTNRSREVVRAIPGELRQVFSNLLANAIEAAGVQGKICIRMRDTIEWSSGRKGTKVVIFDNGPGIGMTERGRLFTPFFSTKGERGTGLGLWLSRSIIEKHEGAIRFRSSSGERHGTAFAVFVPHTGNARPSVQ